MNQNDLTDLLRRGSPVLGDGAMGTVLQASGLEGGAASELWNIEHPDRVSAVYQGYADAGARIIETNTFGGTAARLKAYNLSDRVFDLNRAGVELARRVASHANVLVGGSMGPTGELIEPVGPLQMKDAQRMFAEQARGLVNGGVDLIFIETMSHLNEVEAAIQGIREVAADLAIAVTMSFGTNYHTMMGVSPREALAALSQWGIRAIGANCGKGPSEMETVMIQMAQHRPADTFLIAQSNAGLPYEVDGTIRYDGTPDVMANYAVRMRDLGVDIIGACCGSTPAHIAAMRDALQRVKNDPISGPPALGDGDEVAEQAAGSRRRRRQSAR